MPARVLATAPAATCIQGTVCHARTMLQLAHALHNYALEVRLCRMTTAPSKYGYV